MAKSEFTAHRTVYHGYFHFVLKDAGGLQIKLSLSKAESGHVFNSTGGKSMFKELGGAQRTCKHISNIIANYREQRFMLVIHRSATSFGT